MQSGRAGRGIGYDSSGVTALRRVGRPEEVASVIAFFASDDAAYVSGQTLYVNGGAR